MSDDVFIQRCLGDGDAEVWVIRVSPNTTGKSSATVSRGRLGPNGIDIFTAQVFGQSIGELLESPRGVLQAGAAVNVYKEFDEFDEATRLLIKEHGVRALQMARAGHSADVIWQQLGRKTDV